MPVFKYPPHITAHLQHVSNLSEDAERQHVPNDIDHSCLVAVRLKDVRMMPQSVRSRSLHVYKTMGRIPPTDLGSPAERYLMQAEMITNLSALRNRAGAHGEYLETQPRRRDVLQIASVCKEREYLFDGSRDPLFLSKGMELEAHTCFSPVPVIALLEIHADVPTLFSGSRRHKCSVEISMYQRLSLATSRRTTPRAAAIPPR